MESAKNTVLIDKDLFKQFKAISIALSSALITEQPLGFELFTFNFYSNLDIAKTEKMACARQRRYWETHCGTLFTSI